jgi:hypothetical protein
MKRLSRDSWLALALFVVLVILTVAAARRQTQTQVAPPLASFSSAPDGAAALRLWLEELDYTVSEALFPTFRIPDNTQLVLMLEPFLGITSSEWEIIDAWVEDGGTLLLVGESGGTLLAVRHYDFNLAYLPGQAIARAPQTPLFTSPRLDQTVGVPSNAYFETDRTDFVTHLAVVEGPVLVSFPRGNGRVVLSAAPFPFSNRGLKEAGQPALALNVIALIGRSGQVWFDEWHHGWQGHDTEAAGLDNWLRYTPAGRGLLFAALVIFVALALSGRRFGRPVPLPRETARRAPLEYITAVANLNRRAGHRVAVLRQYRHRLKRSLGRRYRLDPALPDQVYLAELAHLNPDLDTVALSRLLLELARPEVTENHMTRLATEVARWLKEP